MRTCEEAKKFAFPSDPVLCLLHSKVWQAGFIYLTDEEFGMKLRSDAPFVMVVIAAIARLAGELLRNYHSSTVASLNDRGQVAANTYGAWDRSSFHTKWDISPSSWGYGVGKYSTALDLSMRVH